MRKTLITASLMAFLLLQSPAHAQVSGGNDVADDVIEQIEADGYTIIDVARSWFGRIVITANSIKDLREVVLNRTSGEVLRDQRFPVENVPGAQPAPSGDDHGRQGGPDGPGGNGD
ncbi:TrbC/VirB2 family protein [Pseudooceanicola algae]|uniref:PepSY domain-containing protein n=1 Tax=Pseudooceanicola algae TaxID=1537215 RepID=A0A418SLK0_9RHOB|nr:TrbC/VirB2 family protein [Pseudooceanicola algae]QPM90580.1 hypothetical protein PSAL_018190 [Pseudooceanicola algae]